MAKRPLRAADLYCGAGGSTTGARNAGVEVVLAVNHWRTAIFTHQANHPDTRHICARIDDIDPRHDELPDFDLLLAAPECQHHSIARGGRPVEDQRRATPWNVCAWVEARRPKWFVVENVREYMQWGPIHNGKPIKSRKGETFKAWIETLKSLGYRVEYRLLNAADYGEATKRIRLFIVGRRGKGPIPWPEPTHAGKWRPAYEIINWQRECPSIFDRKRPLADKTLRRIEIGLRKFVAPFVVQHQGPGYGDQNYSGVFDPKGPLPTILTRANHSLVVPFFAHLRGTSETADISQPTPTITAGGGHLGLASPFIVPNFGERDGQEPRSHSVDGPLPTVTSHGAGSVAMPFFLPRQGIYDCRKDKPGQSINEPLNTILANHGPGQLVMPFLVKFHGGKDPKRDGTERQHDVNEPLPTIDSQPRFGVVSPFIAQVNYGDDARTGDRTHAIDEPLRTITTHRGQSLIMPFMMDVHDRRRDDKSSDINEPLPTIVTKPGNSIVFPFLSEYYGSADATTIADPLLTITTKHRHSLAMAFAGSDGASAFESWFSELRARYKKSEAMQSLLNTMQELGVFDVGFRMLEADELAAAQGFPPGYQLHGNKAEQIKQIGNAVCPGVMKAICEAIQAA